MYIEFEKGAKHAKQRADQSNDLNAFADAGFIIPSDIVIVDIDNLERDQIDDMIRIFEIKTHTVITDRGVHLYFQKPKGFKAFQKSCALGWTFEYKHNGNTKAITVKRNNVAREVINEGVFEPIPDFLIPSQKISQNFIGYADGDGRNNALFKHKKEIKVENEEKVLRYVNEHVFGEPLPENELNAILKTSSDDAHSEESSLAEKLITDYRVIKYAGELYFYDGREAGYINDQDKLIRVVYQYCDGRNTKYVDEVIKQIAYKAQLIPTDTVFPVKFSNGVLIDGDFMMCSYTEFTPYVVGVEYDPNCKPVKEVDAYLDQLCDKDDIYKRYVLEILSHTLITDPEVKRMLAKFFIFVGDGGNGKGTLLQVIKKILGSHNIATLSIKNMSDERYLYGLKGKLANLGDDLTNDAINNDQMKMLKNISTCDTIEIRKMRENSIPMELTASLIFTSNHQLKSFEKGEAYKRRVMWLPMYTKPTKKDPKFITRITNPEALRYWVKLIVESYIELYKRQTFLECELLETWNAEYHKNNDNIIGYLEEKTIDDFIGRRPTDCYPVYEVWAEDNGLDPAKRNRFKDKVCDVMGLKTHTVKTADNKSTKIVYQLKAKAKEAKENAERVMFDSMPEPPEQEIYHDSAEELNEIFK